MTMKDLLTLIGFDLSLIDDTLLKGVQVTLDSGFGGRLVVDLLITGNGYPRYVEETPGKWERVK